MGCKNSLINRGALAIANATSVFNLKSIQKHFRYGINPAEKQTITAYKLQA